jgi:ribosomal protein S18 acetylase RimI-like enzyme
MIRRVEGPGDLAAVRELWQEYWKSINLPNDFQGFGEEVKGLPGVYGEDGGALLLAWSATTAVGTIALRRLNDRSGEIKRLYLRPASRGQGLGRQLLEQVIERARELKYQSLYADTLPSMNEALSLYARLGFERVEAYASNPTPGAIFLELQLR